jgi:hypothetical protein
MSIMVVIFDFRSTQKTLILLKTIQGRFQPSVIPHYLVFLCELSFLQEGISTSTIISLLYTIAL